MGATATPEQEAFVRLIEERLPLQEKVLQPPQQASQRLNPAQLSPIDLVGGLKPFPFWSVLMAAAGVLAGTFGLGVRLAPSLEKSPRQSMLIQLPGPIGMAVENSSAHPAWRSVAGSSARSHSVS